MIVRDATDDDLPALLELAADFWRVSGYDADGDFDPMHTAQHIGFIRTAGFLLVAERDGVVVGMLGMIAAPGLCSPARKAHEVCWWVAPSARRSSAALRLYRAIEPRVRAMGLAGYVMTHLTSSPAEVASIYEHGGAKLTELSYTKRFTEDR